MPIDRTAFFASVRREPFPGHLNQDQVSGMGAILDAWEAHYADRDLRWLGYALATTFHETAQRMQPIEEFGKGHGHPYGNPDPVTHKAYYGRGLVQLTWLDNYRKMGPIVGVDLVNYPEIALQPDIASKIMFVGMTDGMFTGKKFADYFNATHDDPLHARRIINGMDRAPDIADYHENFMAALTGDPA